MNKKIIILFVVCFLCFFCVSELFSANYNGKWLTTFGDMYLKQSGDLVKGYYISEGIPGQITGKVSGETLEFSYSEKEESGTGWFIMSESGNSFSGKWKESNGKVFRNWSGTSSGNKLVKNKDFSGIWNTTYGEMRLSVSSGKVHGIYLYGSSLSEIEGTFKGNRIDFQYKETATSGSGYFELCDNGQYFIGKWKEKGKKKWKDWNGTRILPVTGRTWLVILEVRWEEGINESEYSYGQMLRSFFARSSNVSVRHRFFDDSKSLRKWCYETAFLAEPVVLVIASHGLETGLQVDDGIIGYQTLAKCLKYSENIKVLNFSSCLIMKDDYSNKLLKSLPERNRFPISGYTTSVDWAASVNIEFMYLDLILNRSLTPQQAAAILPKLIPFAGTKQIDGSPFDSAGFRLLDPKSIK